MIPSIYPTNRILWSRWDSNPHPLPCKGSAQPIELQPHRARYQNRTDISWLEARHNSLYTNHAYLINSNMSMNFLFLCIQYTKEISNIQIFFLKRSRRDSNSYTEVLQTWTLPIRHLTLLWTGRDSNPRRSALQADALPTELPVLICTPPRFRTLTKRVGTVYATVTPETRILVPPQRFKLRLHH